LCVSQACVLSRCQNLTEVVLLEVPRVIEGCGSVPRDKVRDKGPDMEQRSGAERGTPSRN